MRRKSWAVIVISLLVICGCLFFVFINSHHKMNERMDNSARSSFSIRKSHKKQHASQSNSKNYSTNELMLMGYMAYAHDNYVRSRHIQNNQDLVNDVEQDLNDGDLIADYNNSNSYTLTNKFGSVQVVVQNNNVEISGDGNHTENLSKLEQTFGSYTDQIQAMTDKINTQNKVNFTPQQLGVLAGYIRGNKSWVKQCINEPYKKDFTPQMTGYMSYGPGKNGFYTIDGHGDATTVVSYKLDGQTLITEHVEVKVGEGVEDTPPTTKKYPISQVIAKYYSTPEEKAEVNQLAYKLLSDSELEKLIKEKKSNG